MPNPFDTLKNLEMTEIQIVMLNKRIAYINYLTLFSSCGAIFWQIFIAFLRITFRFSRRRIEIVTVSNSIGTYFWGVIGGRKH